MLKPGAAKPEAVQVKLGISDGITSEILSGLEEGQKVVTGLENPPPANGMTKSTNPISGGGPRFR